MGTFASTLLLDILIFHSDASQSLFCLIICIHQFHWLIILSKNYSTLEFDIFQLQNKIKFSVQGKVIFTFLVGALAHFFVLGKISEADCRLHCSKRKNRQLVRINLLVVDLLNSKFYRPYVCHYGFKTQSLT